MANCSDARNVVNKIPGINKVGASEVEQAVSACCGKIDAAEMARTGGLRVSKDEACEKALHQLGITAACLYFSGAACPPCCSAGAGVLAPIVAKIAGTLGGWIDSAWDALLGGEDEAPCQTCWVAPAWREIELGGKVVLARLQAAWTSAFLAAGRSSPAFDEQTFLLPYLAKNAWKDPIIWRGDGNHAIAIEGWGKTSNWPYRYVEAPTTDWRHGFRLVWIGWPRVPSPKEAEVLVTIATELWTQRLMQMTAAFAQAAEEFPILAKALTPESKATEEQVRSQVTMTLSSGRLPERGGQRDGSGGGGSILPTLLLLGLAGGGGYLAWQKWGKKST